MISLNDYLFSGNTVLKILQQYSNDLRNSAKSTHNSIDLAHSNFLIQIIELLEHNEFLTSQSQRIKEFYKYINNQLINDGCGLFRGRQILPFEHLSRFQNDLID